MEAGSQEKHASTPRWTLKVWIVALSILGLLWAGWFISVWLVSKGQKNPIRMLIDAARSATSSTRYLKPPYQYFRTWQHVLAEATRQRRPIFLDLYADWCYPCKKLERETFSHPSVHGLLRKYVMVKFNIDKPEGRSLVNRYRVERFPTTLMVDWQGQEMERVVGFYPPRFFRKPVAAVLDQKETYWNLRTQFRRSSQDWTLALKLADRALLRRSLQEAEHLYRQILQADRKDQHGLGSQALFGLARLHTRDNRYVQALSVLAQILREFPHTRILGDVYRLQLYCYYKLNRNNDYHQTYALFRKKYPTETTKFE